MKNFLLHIVAPYCGPAALIVPIAILLMYGPLYDQQTKAEAQPTQRMVPVQNRTIAQAAAENATGKFVVRVGTGEHPMQTKAVVNGKLIVDANGNESIQFTSFGGFIEGEPVFIGGIITNPGDPDPGDPPPPTNGDTVSKAKAVANQIDDPEVAQRLAVAYFALTALKDQYTSVDQFAGIAKQTNEQIFSSNQASARWAPWRTFYDEEFTRLDQEQNIDTVAEYAAVLDDMRAGLLDSAQDNARLEALDITIILAIVQDVFELLEGGRPINWMKVFEIVGKVIELITANGMQVEGSF